MVISQGCRSIRDTDVKTARYVVQAVVLEARNETGMKRLAAIEETPTDIDSMTNGIVIRTFPDFILCHGQEAEADEREPVSHEKNFNPENRPGPDSCPLSGWMIRAALSVPRLSCPQVRLCVENSELLGWKEYKWRDGKTYKHPVLKHRKLETTVFPVPGRWLHVKDITGVTESGNFALLVRVKGPLKFQENRDEDGK
ncbi:MAG: hypothetical protein ACOC6C_00530 [Verrucomicrobiota bacterium]